MLYPTVFQIDALMHIFSAFGCLRLIFSIPHILLHHQFFFYLHPFSYSAFFLLVLFTYWTFMQLF